MRDRSQIDLLLTTLLFFTATEGRVRITPRSITTGFKPKSIPMAISADPCAGAHGCAMGVMKSPSR